MAPYVELCTYSVYFVFWTSHLLIVGCYFQTGWTFSRMGVTESVVQHLRITFGPFSRVGFSLLPLSFSICIELCEHPLKGYIFMVHGVTRKVYSYEETQTQTTSTQQFEFFLLILYQEDKLTA